MQNAKKEHVILELTKPEALELFSRCLKSHEEDNYESKEVLRKLARAIECDRSLPRAA
jgi:hypothetical protein